MAHRWPPSLCVLTRTFLCVGTSLVFLCVFKFPLLTRTPVQLDSGSLYWPHFNLITSLRPCFQIQSHSEVPEVRVSTCELARWLGEATIWPIAPKFSQVSQAFPTGSSQHLGPTEAVSAPQIQWCIPSVTLSPRLFKWSPTYDALTYNFSTLRWCKRNTHSVKNIFNFAF